MKVFIYRDVDGADKDNIYMTANKPRNVKNTYFSQGRVMRLDGFHDLVKRGECFKAELSFAGLKPIFGNEPE